MFKCSYSRLKLGSLLIFVLLYCDAVGAADLSCTYDSQGRLVRANYGTQMSIVYSYDAGGNPLSIQILNSGVTPAVINNLVPSGAVAGSPGLSLVLTGDGFPADSQVQWNGQNRATVFETAQSLTVYIPASDLTTAGTVNVTVFSQQAGNSNSNTLVFTIAQPTDSYLAGITLSPTRLQAGTSSQGTISLNGPAPNGGATVSLTSNRAEAVVPASVKIAAGESTASFAVTTTAVTSSVAAALTGVYGGLSRTASLVITPDNQSNPASSSFVPILLSLAGANNSFYTTELTLTNRGTATATFDLAYKAAFGGGGGTGSDTLGPGEQRIYPNALAYLKSLGITIPDLGGRGGTLSVRFFGLSSPLDAAVTTRTTTAVPKGRAGLAVPGVPASGGLTGPAYIFGLRQDSRDRSNLAVQSMGGPNDGAITLRLTVFSGDPLTPFSQVLPDIELVPGGFSQISGILNNTQPPLVNGYVRIERVSGSAPYYAYGVINDNQNSDGSFVPPLSENVLSGKSSMTVPVIVDTGSFSSELVLTNWAGNSKTLTLEFVASSISTPDATAKLILTLKPGEQKIVPSFVQYLRDHGVAGIGAVGTSYVGALFISTEAGDLQGIAAGARTTAMGDIGRYGLFYTAVPAGASLSSGGWVYGLQQNLESRSNLAIVNTGEIDDQADQFTIEIFDGRNGQKVGSGTQTIGARGWFQIGTILAPTGIQQGYVRVTRTSGRNPFIVYGVINDGAGPGLRTGDGAFISASQ